jgi:hypothetical protein
MKAQRNDQHKSYNQQARLRHDTFAYRCFPGARAFAARLLLWHHLGNNRVGPVRSRIASAVAFQTLKALATNVSRAATTFFGFTCIQTRTLTLAYAAPGVAERLGLTAGSSFFSTVNAGRLHLLSRDIHYAFS